MPNHVNYDGPQISTCIHGDSVDLCDRGGCDEILPRRAPVNRFPARCEVCFGRVAPGEGSMAKGPCGWFVWHNRPECL